MSRVEKTFRYDGKRYHVYGNTEAEAIEKMGAKKAMLMSDARTADSNMTVAQWADIWLKDYKQGTVNDKWYGMMESMIKTKIDPVIGHKRLKDVKPKDITKTLNSYTNLSESYGKKLRLILNQIFDSAEENDLIIKDPTKRVKLPTYKEEGKRRTITEHERDLTLRTARKNPKVGMPFMLMLYCGLRPGEVMALQMSDIDFQEKTISINKAYKSDGTVGLPKSKSGIRTVPIPDAFIPDLKALKKKPNELVCTSDQGHMIIPKTWRRLWKKFRRLMEIENGARTYRGAIVEPTLATDITPYCYRHTYCTDLQDAGVSVTVASRLMGHSKISVTADIYTHHSNTSFENARDALNRYHRSEVGRTTVVKNAESLANTECSR